MLQFKQQAEQFELFLQNAKTNQLFKANPKNLYDPCEYMLSIGGKRVRPSVCLMAAELFTDEIPESAYWSAVAVEMFHNFTLVHDDIMDQAPLRRGKTTVYKKYNTTAAILSGDVLNILAYQSIQNVAPKFLLDILTLFNKTAIEVCEGQQFDMDFENQNEVSKSEYIKMIRLKTAVLLAASMQMGAICANASESQAQLVYNFGLNLGIAFQLQDDYLDSFGTEAAVGKQIGGDIQANKKTILAIEASLLANADQKATLAALSSQSGAEKLQKTLKIFKTLGVDTICQQSIELYTQKALNALQQLDIDASRKSPFEALLNDLMSRKN